MNDFEVVREHFNLLDLVKEKVYMKKSGREYVGLCPFHSEKTPSFHVNVEKQLFHCKGCDAGGDIFEYVRLDHNTDLYGALELLASWKGIVLNKDNETYQNRKEFQKKQTTIAKKAAENDGGNEYLTSRGLTFETIKKFGLGYGSKHHSIIIPLVDHRNLVVGYAERFIGDPPKPFTSKYRLPSENSDSPFYNELFKKSEFLFNEYNARKALKHESYLLVFEGQFDAISADQLGFHASVAYMQSSMVNEQAKRVIKMAEDNTVIVLVPDKNKAGRISIRKNYDLLKSLNPKIPVKVLNLPLEFNEAEKEKDFNDFIKQGMTYDDAASYIDYAELALIDLMIEQTPDFDLQQENAIDIVQQIKNPFIREKVSKRLAEIWDTNEEKVDKLLSIQRNDDLYKSFKDIDDMHISFMEKLRKSKENSIYLGYAGLDKTINSGMGVPTGWILNFMARSSVGKTAFALNVIMNAIKRHEVGCTFFSFEQQDSDIYPKLSAINSSMDQKFIFDEYKDDGGVIPHEYLRKLLKERLLLFDDRRLDIEQIEKLINAADEKFFTNVPCKVVLIDYLGYIKTHGSNKYEALSELTAELKQVAKRTNKVFIILVQTSRVGGDGSEPVEFSHARDSGTIEENSDILLGAYRPELSLDLDLNELINVTDDYMVQVLKNRNGPTGVVYRLKFDKPKQIIRDWKDKEKELFMEQLKRKYENMSVGDAIKSIRGVQ